MRKRIINTALAFVLGLSLTACGTATATKNINVEPENKPASSKNATVEANASEGVSAVNVNKTEEGTKVATGGAAEGDTSGKSSKEVYNCCGFIEDSGVTVKIAGIKGNDIVGLVKLFDNAKQDKTVNGYDFSLSSTTEELGDKLVKGELDMAVLPIETAVKLYDKTGGNIRMVATTVIDTTKKWDESNKKKHSLSGIFTTANFVKENKHAVDALLGDYSYSVMWMTEKDNGAEADKLIKEYGAADTDKAAKVIASGKVACLRGETMKKAAKTYLDALKKVDKKAVNELPKDNFYYIRDAK